MCPQICLWLAQWMHRTAKWFFFLLCSEINPQMAVVSSSKDSHTWRGPEHRVECEHPSCYKATYGKHLKKGEALRWVRRERKEVEGQRRKKNQEGWIRRRVQARWSSLEERGETLYVTWKSEKFPHREICREINQRLLKCNREGQEIMGMGG